MSIYFKLSKEKAKNKKAKLKIVEDLYNGDSLKHYKEKWIPEGGVHDMIPWKKRFNSHNYFKHVIDQSVNFITSIDTLKGASGRSLTAAEKEKFELFKEKNDWKNLTRKIARNRKLYGDVYIYWYISKHDEHEIPILKILDSKNVEIFADENQEIFAYIHRDDVVYHDKKNFHAEVFATSNNSQIESRTMTTIFEKGVSTRYDGTSVTAPAISMSKLAYSKLFPVIHIQYEKEIDTNYSAVPAFDLIDQSLELDKITTDINQINTMAGAPQIIAMDATLDSDSTAIGPNSIAYFDTSDGARDNGKTGSVTTIEITNGLSSQYQQMNNALDLLYEKAKLIPPSILQSVIQSDSSKVVSSIKKSIRISVISFFFVEVVPSSVLIS